eukprot:15453988-Alexandrium_andersonii.AAC.1
MSHECPAILCRWRADTEGLTPVDMFGVAKGVSSHKRCRLEISGDEDSESDSDDKMSHNMQTKNCKRVNRNDLADALAGKAAF